MPGKTIISFHEVMQIAPKNLGFEIVLFLKMAQVSIRLVIAKECINEAH